MYGPPLTPIEPAEAEAALRAAAHTTRAAWNRPVVQVVHTFGAGGFIGADWRLENALEFLAAAIEVAWVTHPIRHDLVVNSGGSVVCFDCPRPERSSE